jgi:hypothetical protein
VISEACKFEGCELPVNARGYCKNHYYRVRQHGGADVVLRTEHADHCLVPECQRSYYCRGYCRPHYERFRANGNPGGNPIGYRPTGTESPRWKGRDITYGGAHVRVRARRGLASAHPCAHCAQPAAQWAYDHDDPSELRDQSGHFYSVFVDHYIPLCLVCHKRFDLNYLGGRPDVGPT